MEGFVAQKIDDYQTGKISGRRLIETLTPAATTLYAQDAKAASSNPALKVALVNHVSYTCPNFQQVRTGIRRSSISTKWAAQPETTSRCLSARKATNPWASPQTMCRSRL